MTPTIAHNRHGREDGVALVSVLCLLTTAGLLVSALVAVSRMSTLNVASFTDLMRSYYVAEGAANRIRYLIEADREVFGDQDAQTIDFDEYEYDRYVADGSEHEIDYYGTPVKFTITNGISGYVISSAADVDALATNRTEETLVTDAIDIFQDRYNDYVDSDDTVREDGMEEQEYEELGMKALPRNSDLQYREELLWIPGSEELFPTDADGRLSMVRNFRISSTANPSIYTATYGQLRTQGHLTAEEAAKVLQALKEWREEKTPLSDLLDETILPKLQTYFSWTESNFYTVRIFQTNQDQRPGSRLIFTFEADGIRGPSSGVATFLEYFRF